MEGICALTDPYNFSDKIKKAIAIQVFLELKQSSNVFLYPHSISLIKIWNYFIISTSYLLYTVFTFLKRKPPENPMTHKN